MQILLAKQFFLCFYFSMLNCGDFYFYSFHAAILNFAKSVERNPKENGAAKLQITFLFSNNSATIFFKFLGGGKLLFINTLYILIHPQPHNLLISAHVVNQIGQGVPGGIHDYCSHYDAIPEYVGLSHAFGEYGGMDAETQHHQSGTLSCGGTAQHLYEGSDTLGSAASISDYDNSMRSVMDARHLHIQETSGIGFIQKICRLSLRESALSFVS